MNRKRSGTRTKSFKPVGAMGYVLVGLVVWFLCRSIMANAVSNKPVTIQPEAEIQAQIQCTLNALDEDAFRKHLSRLAKMGGRNYEKLVPQLVYYSMYGTNPKGGRDVKEAMALGIVAGKLEIDAMAIARALLPYLDTHDKHLRNELYEVFAGCNFTDLRCLIDARLQRGDEAPLGLIRFMYQRKPGDALLALSATPLLAGTPEQRRERSRSLLWAEHVIADTLWKHEHGFLPKSKVEPDAMAELERLSKEEAWWVRLYAAHVIKKAPAFWRADVASRLDKDSHPLVREAMGFIQQQQPPPPRTAPKESPFGPPPPPRAEKSK